MADGNWLRILAGQRSRTPAKRASPPDESSSSKTTAAQKDKDDQQRQQKDSQKVDKKPAGDDAGAASTRRPRAGHSKALSKLPSWPGLSHGSSMPAASKSSSRNLLVRESDRVAHDPSTERIVDSLLTAVMSKDALEPLGPEHGASILHLIEGYRKAKKEAMDLQAELAQVLERQQKEHDEFESLVTEWTIQEARYKAEIKRLEVIIHRTSDSGLEAVSMARSGSLIGKGFRTTAHDQDSSALDAGAKGDASANHHDDTIDGIIPKFVAPPPHRQSLLGRPRILDPRSDVALSWKLYNEPIFDDPSSVLKSHAVAAQPPYTISPGHSLSSSSSDAQESTERPVTSGSVPIKVLRKHPSPAERQHHHHRDFSFARKEGCDKVTQDEVDIGHADPGMENTTGGRPHTLPITGQKANVASAATSKPAVAGETSTAMGDAQTGVGRSRNAGPVDASVARSTSTVKHISGESPDG